MHLCFLEPKGQEGKAAWAYFTVTTLSLRLSRNQTNILPSHCQLASGEITPTNPPTSQGRIVLCTPNIPPVSGAYCIVVFIPTNLLTSQGQKVLYTHISFKPKGRSYLSNNLSHPHLRGIKSSLSPPTTS